MDKYKNCPKLELDYKQNLREQLGIIFNLENIINQKLFSVQRQLENNWIFSCKYYHNYSTIAFFNLMNLLKTYIIASIIIWDVSINI